MTLRDPALLTPLLMMFAFSVHGEPPLPQDVQHFLSNAEMCQHLAGEWDSSLPEEDKKDIKRALIPGALRRKKHFLGYGKSTKKTKRL
ncbi:hypothetical protein [Salmonella enterica]|uniref:hypothetical protein n=1 Tax=Salmonella enterica TaxID=28901 RepID=UPI00019112AC|nr:hypothetical protein [Salmonella enterica]MDJ3477883.1 hypothetical protein [Salmonella enterica]MDJ3619949.1 hypothetical protein [Salmonella enterica]MDJ3702242.1 hypothetical protein [Salmonella enterica]MDJ3944729.1 hypothetical protein [Salmonella enterica]MDJ3975251.1 hypothetical protein [Salmonella enterica]